MMKLQSVLLLTVSLLFAQQTLASDAEPRKELRFEDSFTLEKKSDNKKQSRLRFKSDGPTCMCAGGLTEKDLKQTSEKIKQ